jgi:Fe2+ or Zn2+ uptake regulation protein
MTGKTERILDFLATASAPVAAGDVARGLEGLCDLATVYRTLHRLERTGKVESFAFECRERGIERYYQRRQTPHRHFFHCESCHRFIDVGSCRLSQLTRDLERDLGARIEAHTLYFTGRCAACRTEDT